MKIDYRSLHKFSKLYTNLKVSKLHKHDFSYKLYFLYFY